ncbi:GNAT family N-acetyltransferase [Gracilinema caldarium]|uniref:GCN5-related N-acetyltransferase n=1 Tax=Gracilinema caldarium (strain ATCC 51460 / DSM 7334 / H1) TaxID=744872 RepID=F8F0D3_GRAC1|nr:GNAT family N-acetyltransferase [Gracilinema caldarium]AEJ18997.1 GCN5-related N-acetyltransferase [Gracilinema caldarium DSM 7334]
MTPHSLHWRTAHSQDYDSFSQFLQNHEPYLVAAASRFRAFRERSTKTSLPGRNHILIGMDNLNHIQSFIFRSGQILHPFFLDYDAERAQRVLRRFINLPFSKRIYSLQGLEQDVKIAEQALEQEGYRIQDQFDYYLMQLDTPVLKPPQPEGLTLIELAAIGRTSIKQASIRQVSIEGALAGHAVADLLYPLQAAYEQEEVIPAHSTFNQASCRRGLAKILSEETIVYAAYEGLPVAKANTNATAYRYKQIGGVYVQPEFRGRGIASSVVGTLLARIQQQGYGVSLFVKKRNLPAIRLYERLGFVTIGSYRIVYY